MKFSILFLTATISCLFGYCQKDTLKSNPFLSVVKPIPVYPKYPNSFLNVGIGLGPNYGGMGGKIVFGYKNSGICLGV